MRVAIAIHRWEGHRLYYVRLLAIGAAEHGEVSVILPVLAIQSNEFAVNLADLVEAGIEFRTIDFEAPETVLGTRSALRLLEQIIAHSADADSVVLPEADELLLAVAVQAPSGWLKKSSLLVMRTARPTLRNLLRPLFKVSAAHAVAKRGSRLSTLTDSFGKRPAAWGYRSFPRVRDPSPAHKSVSPTLTREVLGLRSGDCVFGTLGPQDARKNLPLLLDVWRTLPPAVPAVLVVAGPVPAYLRPLIGEAYSDNALARRLVVLDRYLSDGELSALMLEVIDHLLLIYQNDGPSGLLARAAAINRPVLAAGGPWLRSLVEENGLGTFVDLRFTALREAVIAASRLNENIATAPPARLGTEKDFTDLLLGVLR